jgi:hypothetical protein
MVTLRTGGEAVNCGNGARDPVDHSVRISNLYTGFSNGLQLLASRLGRSLSGRRAVDGGAILERKLPSENAPACIGMGEPSFFDNQGIYRKA